MPGYEVKFVNPLLKRHECPVCLYAMRNPVQTECGHLFCRECLDPVLKRKRPICPLDKEDINADSIFPDNACRREILNLEVYCPFVSGGCEWIGQLKKLEEHQKSCEYRETQCTQCGQYIQYLILSKHEAIECPMRPEPCPHCKKDIPSQQLQHHIEKLCSKVLHICPNGCESSRKFTLEELEKHLDIKSGDCPLMELKCPYSAYGCSFVSQRKNMPLHFQQNQQQHIMIQTAFFTEVKEASDKTNKHVQHLMERVSGLESRSMAVEQLQDALEQKVKLLSDQRERMSEKIDGRVQVMESQTTRINNSVSQLTRKVEDLQVGASGGSPGLGFPVSSGYMSLPPTGSAVTITPQRVEELQRKVGEVEHSVDRALGSCLEQELRIQLLERATYDGVLLWKIDEFDRRRREAIDGTTMSLYSTPFYTSRHGYKMCARIYLNGDGMGKNTHLSFFFVVMRGPFDGLLQWPFKQKVTLTLLNQAGKKHVSDSFRPDPNSSSCQRPGRREMNIASGCPMFIRLEHLLNGGFVKDDCVYVRVVVESRSMAVEQLQDALEQKVQLLSDQRERMSEKIEGRVQVMESQTSQLTRKEDDLQVGASGGSPGIGFPVSSGYMSLPPTELQRKVGEVEHSVDRALGSCLEQELRIQLLERATYDGVLLWKIDEFDRRRQEAIDGTTMSLDSTPFYTSRHGYKMCARIYLNGDGMGKNTHLSFFFVVMKGGPCDDLLQWPFKQKVTLTLLNQAGKKHVSDSFRPDPNSSSFQHPGRRDTSECSVYIQPGHRFNGGFPGYPKVNTASGFPMFIHLEHLLSGGFVKDDCIYVTADVDVSDLPKIPGQYLQVNGL